MEKRLLIILLVVIFFLLISLPIFFYFYNEKKEKEEVIKICIEKCRTEMIRGIDLTSGPCLLDPVEKYSNWVCDVVHVPRQEVDDLAENQCKSYLKGRAKHFVEVSTSCEFVRAR